MTDQAANKRQIRVMLIDDEVNSPHRRAYGYVAALNEAGMLVHMAFTAGDAIQHIEANQDPEDVVILDLMLDGGLTIDGTWYDQTNAGIGILRHRLRNRAYRYCHVPVLILTNRDPADPFIADAAGLRQVHVSAKSRLPPHELPDLVQAQLMRQP